MAIRLPAIMQVFRVDTSDLERARGEASELGSGLGASIAKGVAVGGAALAGLGAVGVRGASKIETGLAEVVSLTGLVGDEARTQMGVFSDVVREVSDEFGIAQDELTGGLYNALSAGVPADNVFDFMRVASKASIAGVTDVDTAVDGITTTLNAFGLDASEAEGVADSMFTTVKGGKTTFEELSGALFNVAPAAAAAGVDFRDVNAALAALTAAGTPTSVATTQVRAALVALQKPSEEMDEIFQKLGHTNAAAAIESEGLQYAINAVGDAADGDAGKLQGLLGSVEAVGAVQTLAGTGAEAFTEALANQGDAAGAVGDGFAVMADTTEHAWSILKTRLMNAVYEVGGRALPLLNDGLALLTQGFAWASSNAETLTPWLIGIGSAIALFVIPPLLVYIQQQLLAGAAAIRSAAMQWAASVRVIASWVAQGAAAAAQAVRVVASWVATGAGALRSAAMTVASGARVVATWALMGIKSLAAAAKVALAWLISIGPIALVIAAVVGLVVLVVKYWDEIKEFVTRAAKAVWGFVVRAFTGIRDGVTSAVQRARDTVVGVFNRIRSAISSAISSVVGYVRALPGRLLDGLRGLATRVVAFVMRYHPVAVLWRAMRGGQGQVLGFVRGLPARILRGLGNMGRLLYNAGRSILQGLTNGIRSLASGPIDAVKGVVSGVRNLLPFSPAKEGPFAGRGAPLYSGLAISGDLAEGIMRNRGEVARASMALAGAAQPDLAGTNPTVAAGQPAAGGLGGVNVSVTARDPAEAARQTAAELGWLVGGRV